MPDSPSPSPSPPPSHAAINPATARPARFHGPVSETFRYLCIAFLKLSGWTIHGDWPRHLPRAVLIAAPHTSNWDGIYMLAAAGFYRIKLRWMGKKSLTTGPFGPIVRWLGCVPIDRSGSNNMVSSMATAFAERDHMILAIPPEATRALSREWKSGFYHIAHTASVPLIVSVLDYKTRTITLAATITTSGDYEADRPLIQKYYETAEGKHAAKFSAGA